MRAIGPSHTSLLARYILAHRVIAHQMAKSPDISEGAGVMGFKRVDISGGYDETWSWNLN